MAAYVKVANVDDLQPGQVKGLGRTLSYSMRHRLAWCYFRLRPNNRTL